MRDYGLLELLSSLRSKGKLLEYICTVGIAASALCAHPHPEKTLLCTKVLMPIGTAHRKPPCWQLHKSSSPLKTPTKSLLEVIYSTP